MPDRPLHVAAVALLAFCLVADAGAALAPGDHLRDLPSGGLPRQYRLHVPPGYDGSTPVPLVVDMHGLSSNSTQQSAISGMRAVADAEGFLVAYPDGWRNAWNAKLCCGNPDVDDVGFIRAVVAAVAAEANVDPGRIYATGLSNGGAMTHRLACDAADLFAAAAPMAFPLAYRPAPGCQPSRSIPVLTVMGLTDELIRYDGGFGTAVDTFAHWTQVNGCLGPTPDVVDARGLSRCEYYTACANDVQVGLCSVTALAFPGARFSGHLLYLNDDFDLARVAWDFLSRFTLPDGAAPAGEAELSGDDRVRLGGLPRGSRLAPLRWTVRLGHGTWAANDAGGTAFGGSWRRRAGRRSGTAELTAAARDALQALVADRVGMLTGSTGVAVAIEPAGPITLAFDRAGRPTSLGGRWRLRRGDASGPRLGTYTLRLRRSR